MSSFNESGAAHGGDSECLPEVDEDHHPAGTELFSGDCGTLSLETRRALVQLLQGPAIDGRRHSKLWQVLLREEKVLRQHLHNLFLELVVDYDQSVAFTRQVVAESVDIPVLLRKAPLTFIESALVVFLRQRLTQADAAGDRAVVSSAEIYEYPSVFEKDRNQDHARFERQMENAVEKVKKLSLLHKIRGGEDRFEVSPTLKLLFPAEEIDALAKTYRALATEQVGGGDVATGAETDSEAAPRPDDDADEQEAQ